MELTGTSFIGSHRGSRDGSSFHSFAPQTGEPIQPVFRSATPQELERAVRLAHEAFASYAQTSGKTRAAFLRRIADAFESHPHELAERAHLETALPIPRLTGEVTRTANQFRMFAGVVEEGSWVQARIDPALPNRQPLPRPDIRSMLRPLGPVAVFGASNFPLAFSVAGGDTASALAAGCPVLVKAHPAHPGTAEMVARPSSPKPPPPAISSRASSPCSSTPEATSAPPLSSIPSSPPSLSPAHSAPAAPSWISPPPVPIPSPASPRCPAAIRFSSFPALRKAPPRSHRISSAHSPWGAGQFCTKPGMVFVAARPESTAFLDALSSCGSGAAPADGGSPAGSPRLRIPSRTRGPGPLPSHRAHRNSRARSAQTKRKTPNPFQRLPRSRRDFIRPPEPRHRDLWPLHTLVTCDLAMTSAAAARALDGPPHRHHPRH